MEIEQLYKEIADFSKETHGSTNYDQETCYVRGERKGEYAPLKYLTKKLEGLNDLTPVFRKGFIANAFDLIDESEFFDWFENQFGRKLKRSFAKKITIVHEPDNKTIFDAIEQVDKSYQILREQQIIFNGKNLPVQLGEWYAKCIFGLRQVKSTSQRGFDFELDGKRVEVKIHWADQSSPKGVKLRKSLLDLSDYCIVIYMARNFMIREVCLLDSEYILRKFASKGHNIFLKDTDISNYFFSVSDKHRGKVVNPTALLKFSSPTFAMKVSEYFQE